ncbi:MAG: hypothetical protein QOG87_3354 [Actinomycetota bacterium]|jgi:hypothetical protein
MDAQPANVDEWISEFIRRVKAARGIWKVTI